MRRNWLILRLAIPILAATLVLGACSLGTGTKKSDDSEITTDIQAKLFQDPVLKLRDVRVSTQNGVVTLAGSVNTELEKSAVERFASQTNGVKQVVDELTVANELPSQQAAPVEQQQPVQQAFAQPTLPSRPHSRHTQTRRKIRALANAEPSVPAAAPAAGTPALPAQASAAAPAPASVAPVAAAPVHESAPPPPPAPVRVTIPSGTVVTVQLIDSIDSQRNHPGDEFAASVYAPIVADDKVVIPRGADAKVRMVEATSAGHIKGTPSVKLELASITFKGRIYETLSGYFEKLGPSRSRRSQETIGGGAGLGAIIGAIAGGGKGAAIGSVIGAGAGTATQEATHAAPVRIPSETKLDFTLKAPIEVTLRGEN